MDDVDTTAPGHRGTALRRVDRPEPAVLGEPADVNVLTASLRPLADVLDLTAEAVAALGSLSVGALTVVLARADDAEYPALTVVESPAYR